jgi:ribonuclease P protein component
VTTPSAGAQASRRIRAGVLSRQADFDRIYRQGKRVRGRFITAITLSQPEATVCRVAYVVSRKVAKQAVRRNRIRRRLREAWRRLTVEHGLAIHPDLILIASTRAVQASYADLRAELRELLRRAGVWARPATEEDGA